MQQQAQPRYAGVAYPTNVSATPAGQVYGGPQLLSPVPQQPQQYVGGAAPGYGVGGAAPGYNVAGAAPGYGPPTVMYNSNPAQYAQQPQYTGLPQTRMVVPPGMTRESLQPGYVPGLPPDQQRRIFDPQWSFKDSFGNSRSKKCCTIS